MCKVSDKLKLCSCNAEKVESLKHFWVLNRPENLGQRIIGEIMPPADIGKQIENFNIERLRKHLNDGNCFDVILSHQEKDILELHFTCKQRPKLGDAFDLSGNYLVYAFVFKKGKWRKTSYDAFNNNMSFVQEGKIMNPFTSLPSQSS